MTRVRPSEDARLGGQNSPLFPVHNLRHNPRDIANEFARLEATWNPEERRSVLASIAQEVSRLTEDDCDATVGAFLAELAQQSPSAASAVIGDAISETGTWDIDARDMVRAFVGAGGNPQQLSGSARSLALRTFHSKIVFSPGATKQDPAYRAFKAAQRLVYVSETPTNPVNIPSPRPPARHAGYSPPRGAAAARRQRSGWAEREAAARVHTLLPNLGDATPEQNIRTAVATAVKAWVPLRAQGLAYGAVFVDRSVEQILDSFPPEQRTTDMREALRFNLGLILLPMVGITSAGANMGSQCEEESFGAVERADTVTLAPLKIGSISELSPREEFARLLTDAAAVDPFRAVAEAERRLDALRELVDNDLEFQVSLDEAESTMRGIVEDVERVLASKGSEVKRDLYTMLWDIAKKSGMLPTNIELSGADTERGQTVYATSGRLTSESRGDVEYASLTQPSGEYTLSMYAGSQLEQLGWRYERLGGNDPYNLKQVRKYFQDLVSAGEDHEVVAAQWSNYLETFYIHNGPDVRYLDYLDDADDAAKHAQNIVDDLIPNPLGQRITDCEGYAYLTHYVFNDVPGYEAQFVYSPRHIATLVRLRDTEHWFFVNNQVISGVGDGAPTATDIARAQVGEQPSFVHVGGEARDWLVSPNVMFFDGEQARERESFYALAWLGFGELVEEDVKGADRLRQFARGLQRFSSSGREKGPLYTG